MPSQVTKTVWKKAPGRALGIPQQTVDLTPNTATVTDRNPFWSSDETSIIFDSNRKDLPGTTADTRVHIYRMFADGSQVVALTGPLAATPIGVSASQSEPAVNTAGNSLVYVQNTPGDGADLESGAVDLIELNLGTGVAKSLIANNPSGFSFTGLNHPEYGVTPGGNFAVIFGGRLQGHTNFNLFAIDTQTLVITQLTTGIADDRNPTQSPYDAANRNKLVIAFDSNRADSAGASVKANRDIWVLPVGTTNDAAPATQVTTFQVGSGFADNIQPAWSTNKIDQVRGGQQFVDGRQLIAFASTRYDTNGDGNANGINPNGSHDIYWIRADIGPDPKYPSMGWYTVLSPETVTNAAIKLNTSDPNHVYDDVKPTWPQFIKTYRVAYQTNRTSYDEVTNQSQPPVPLPGVPGTPRDIFASTLIDLNAPTLVRYNETTGDIVGVEPRIAQPGSSVKISVKLADLESGIRDVWVQIKNPNSKYQSSDGLEHKVFLFQDLNLDQSNIALRVPIEYENQRIYIGSNPDSSQAYTYDTPKYVASIDDTNAFSGGNHSPSDPDPLKDPGWLQLQLESRDPTTGVCTYSANWKTAQYASDFYIDVIAYDNAVDPFTADTSNWRIYDNIWGFSTQAFNPQSGILFVSDHSEGQKFFGSRFGGDALVNVFNTFWGTESWLTDIDVNLLPRQYRNGTTIGQLVNVRNMLGAKSYGAADANDSWTTTYQFDAAALDGTKVENKAVDLPVTQQYDIWRIQCRGPVPDALLQQYTPHVEQQPSDSTGTGTPTPRNVLVSARCVIWNAPYAGSLFQAPGSITDLSTQSKLQNFVNAGGRLFVTGQDVGWALTVNGTVNSSFMSSVLKATFRQDDQGGVFYRVTTSGTFPLGFNYSPDYSLVSPATPWNPIVIDPFRNTVGFHHQYPGPTPDGNLDPLVNPVNWLVGGNPPAQQTRNYGCPGDFFPDGVAATGTAVTDFTYTGNGLVALMHYEDASNKAKVVYAPMGVDGYHHDAFPPPNTTNILAMKNRGASLFHNAVCWMRTGVISGSVVDTEAKPLTGVLVRLLRGTTTIYTAVTDGFGRFLINGVEPDNYQVSGVKAGFQTQKPTLVWVHGGGGRDDINIRMTLAEKSTIKGTVTRFGSTVPVVGATITATEIVPVGGPAVITPTVVTGTSDATGAYTVANVPSGVKYTLTCTAVGYGDSVPLTYTIPDATAGTVVAPATEYSPFNFQLKAEQGVVEGTVVAWDANAPNNVGAPISGAVVTATQGTLTVVATTDGSGNFSFNKTNATPNGLDPGTWGIVATAPGYGPNNPAATATVVSGTIAVRPDQDPIKLKTVPPGSISGLVTGSADGKALGGVVIEVRDQAGKLVTSNGPDGTDAGVQIDPVTNNPYNYTLSVPAGPTYVVTAVKSGFSCSPVSRSVTVTSQQTTKNIDFEMQPLWTFRGTTSMVSAPYDYPSPITAGSLLGGIGSDSSFKFATWDLGQYVYYPTAPASTFRLGRGYWLGYKSNIALSTQGVSADPTQVFEIPLNPGWNMIGDPFTFDIDWTRVSVRTGAGVLDHDAAVAAGKIGVAMYTFQGTGSGSGSYVIDFTLSPWIGYWVRAFEPVTLLVDPVASKRSVKVASNSRAALLQAKGGWSVNLRLGVGGAADTDNYIGVDSRATDGPDGFKMEKPPVYLSKYATLRIEHTDWGTRSADVGLDLRSNSPGQKVWNVAVDTSVANATASVNWPNVASVGRGVTLTLTDLATGTVRDMRSTAGYTWSTGDVPAMRRFRITASRTAGTQLRITGVAARASRGSSTYSIGYTLSTGASVQIRVLSATGSEVRALGGGSSRAAGVNQATWDLKDARGASVPAGMYLVEITAHVDDTGQTARGIGTVNVIR